MVAFFYFYYGHSIHHHHHHHQPHAPRGRGLRGYFLPHVPSSSTRGGEKRFLLLLLPLVHSSATLEEEGCVIFTRPPFDTHHQCMSSRHQPRRPLSTNQLEELLVAAVEERFLRIALNCVTRFAGLSPSICLSWHLSFTSTTPSNHPP